MEKTWKRTMITRVVPLPSSGSGDARIVRLGASRIVSRRNFLIQGGGALAALSLGSTGCSDNGTGPSNIGDGRNGPDVEEQSVDVIVVGAGLSGLVAAYELVRAGYNVRVLEARNEAGGRARTLREPFDDGLIAEAGPARIPPDHDRTLGYIDHFGIKTSPFYPQEGEYLFVTEQGDTLREPPDVFLSGGRDTWVKMPEGTDVLPMGVRRSARRPCAVWLASDEGRPGGLRGAGHQRNGRLHGGAEGQLPHLHRPLPVIDQIVFEPTLSEKKRAAFEALTYVDVTRVYVQYADRIWEGHGLNGWGRSLVGGFWEFWHPTWNQEGPRGLLMSYLYGDMARTVAAMEHGTIVPEFIDRFDGFFPGSSEVAEHGTYFAWSTSLGLGRPSPLTIRRSRSIRSWPHPRAASTSLASTPRGSGGGCREPSSRACGLPRRSIRR